MYKCRADGKHSAKTRETYSAKLTIIWLLPLCDHIFPAVLCKTFGTVKWNSTYKKAGRNSGRIVEYQDLDPFRNLL